MGLVMRKQAFCICENKDADQLRGNREADQRLCFRYTDSTIPLLPKYEISSLWPSCVVAQPGLCGAWSETPKTGFLTTRLIWLSIDSRQQIFACMVYDRLCRQQSRTNGITPRYKVNYGDEQNVNSPQGLALTMRQGETDNYRHSVCTRNTSKISDNVT